MGRQRLMMVSSLRLEELERVLMMSFIRLVELERVRPTRPPVTWVLMIR